MLRIKALLIILVLLLHSCRSTVELNTDAPATSTTEYKPQLSVINIPVSFDINQLETRLNEEIKGVIYKDESYDGDNVKYTVKKAGKINIMADNNTLYLSLPLHVDALGKFEWQACDFCPKLSKSQDGAFDFTIKTQTAISLTEDWKVQTKTSGNYTWDKTPMLELGPLKIPLTMLDVVLKPQMAKLSVRFDEELQKRIDIKPHIVNAWKELQKPILLNSQYNLWLAVEPKEVSVSSIEMVNDEVKFTTGIRSYINTVSGQKPLTSAAPLPKLNTGAKADKVSSVSIAGDISYEKASELIRKELAGKTYYFQEDKYKVFLNDISLLPLGEKMLVTMNIKGDIQKGKKGKSVKGKVFLEGVPYYDAATQSIKVKELDYTVDTRNVLLKTASWVAEIGFGKKIQEQLTIPLGDEIEKSKSMLQKSLNDKIRLNEYMYIKGKLDNIKPEGIYLTKDGIKAVVNAEGAINVVVDGF